MLSAFNPGFSLEAATIYMQWIYLCFYSGKSYNLLAKNFQTKSASLEYYQWARFYKYFNMVMTLCSKSYGVNIWSAQFQYAVNNPLNQREILRWIK